MRAVYVKRHGGREQLQIEELLDPEVGRDELCIQVHAAGVNPVDWKIRSGQIPMASPPFVPGAEASGVVLSAGAGVRHFQVGDEVWLMTPNFLGCYAERVVAAETIVSRRPTGLSHIEAASVPLAGLTALQALTDHGQLRAGERVLINGASGGVGIFALQIAKALGAEVTAVCSGDNESLVSGLGADRVIDYRKADFREGRETYDLIFDVMGRHSAWSCRAVLGGRFVTTLPPRGLGRFLSRERTQVMLVEPSQQGLDRLGELIDGGQLRTVIDSTYPLEQVEQAHARSESHRARGKIVLSVQR